MFNSINTLRAGGYKVIFTRFPNLAGDVQKISIPSLGMTPNQMATPFRTLPLPSGDINYEHLALSMLIDEDMHNYEFFFNWIRRISTSEELNYPTGSPLSILESENPTSDIKIIIEDSNRNSNIEFSFTECFPIHLSSIDFSSVEESVRDIDFTVIFNYTKIGLKRLV
jgi:hypothetical protein